MPHWLEAIILGLVEGITEFIPVSSTGHLLIAEKWLPKESQLFNVVIQSGAALALIPLFWRKFSGMMVGLAEKSNRDLLARLLLAFLITVAGGIVMKKLGASLEKTSVTAVAWATLIGGLVIFAVEAAGRRRVLSDEITWTLAALFGVGQLIAIGFPGASRSGSTIMLAMAFGLARPAATEFSFLLGVPTLFAAGAKELYDELKDHQSDPESWSHLGIGFLAAAVSSFVVVRWLIRYVQHHSFNGFAVYRVILGVVLLLWFSNR